MKKHYFLILSAVLFTTFCTCKGEQKSMTGTNNLATIDTAVIVNKVDPAKNPDMKNFVKEVDINNDGKMTKAEWNAKKLPESSFNGFEKGRGFVTLEDYTVNAAPPGIDGNGDGILTVAEFVAFDKLMSEKIKNGELPPPPKK